MVSDFWIGHPSNPCSQCRNQKPDSFCSFRNFLISGFWIGAILVPNSEIRHQKVSEFTDTFWFLISELFVLPTPAPNSEIRIRKFLNLQKLSGVLFSRRWRLTSFHKRRAEFVAMPHIATYRISGRPLIPIVYSSCFLLLQEPQTAQTARPRSSSVEKRRLYYFHLNYPTTGL